MKSIGLTIFVIAAVASFCLPQSKSDEAGKTQAPAANPMRGKQAGDVRDDNGLKMRLVWCPPGSFTMEDIDHVKWPAIEKNDELSNDDDAVDLQDAPAPKPQVTEKVTPVKVFLTNGYWLGKYEVTQSEWKQVMNTTPWKLQDQTKEGDDFPATFVSWNAAMASCRNFTQEERQAGRLSKDWEYTLPTEAQWERACRARTETEFSFGDDESKLGEYAWISINAALAGEAYAHQVGRKKPNPWGLHDIHGNVWEWCRDVYIAKLPGGRDPEATEKGSDRVMRGGDWHDSTPGVCRSALRGWLGPSFRDYRVGFRVALNPSRNK